MPSTPLRPREGIASANSGRRLGSTPPTGPSRGLLNGTNLHSSTSNRFDNAAFEAECKLRAASSLVSTSAPSDSIETTPRKPEPAEPKPVWSVQQTFRLGVVGEEEDFLGRARLLDTNVVSSVQNAIDRLNRGTIGCHEESCIVYSASSEAYFLLYRAGSREKAITQLNLFEEALDTSDGSTAGEADVSQMAPVHDGPSGSASATSSSQQDPSASPTQAKSRRGQQVAPNQTPQRALTKAQQELEGLLSSGGQLESGTAGRRRRNSPPRSRNKALPGSGSDRGSHRRFDRPGAQLPSRGGASNSTPGSAASTAVAAAAAACAAVREGDLLEDGEKLLADAKALLECADRTIKTFKESPPLSTEDIFLKAHLQQGVAAKLKMAEDLQNEESTNDQCSSGSNSTAGVHRDGETSSHGHHRSARAKKGIGTGGLPTHSSRKMNSARAPPNNLQARADRRHDRRLSEPRYADLNAEMSPALRESPRGERHLQPEVDPEALAPLASATRGPEVMSSPHQSSDDTAADEACQFTQVPEQPAPSVPPLELAAAEQEPAPPPPGPAAAAASATVIAEIVVPLGADADSEAAAAVAVAAAESEPLLLVQTGSAVLAEEAPKPEAPHPVEVDVPEQTTVEVAPAGPLVDRAVASSVEVEVLPREEVVAVVVPSSVEQEANGEAAQEPLAATVAPKTTPANDASGKEIGVGNRSFQLIKVIGRGAFGVVWHARERPRVDPSTPESAVANGSSDSSAGAGGAVSSELVAVKAVFANNAKAFATATFEAELLQLLTAKLPRSAWERVPRYISHSVLPGKSAEGNGGSVRLAMTFVRGCSLDQWLYAISDEEHKQVEIDKLVEGRLPGGQQRTMRLSRACTFVQCLLSQLAGVFSYLQSLAFHRDVSSHNVLIDVRDGQADPKFALIDFGLAVRSGSWHQEWCTSNLAGDPRYWTPPAWMAFAFGFRYVETHPNRGFHRQYLTRIDHFGLGVLGLEVLFSLWDPEFAEEDGAKSLLPARKAWCSFWEAVIRLFQMFHRQGSTAVRQHLARSPDEGVSRIAGHLRLLRQVLRSAAGDIATQGNPSLSPLLNLLMDLVDERGVVTWHQIPGLLSEEPREACPSERTPQSSTRFDVPNRENDASDSAAAAVAKLASAAAASLASTTAMKQVLRSPSTDRLSRTIGALPQSSSRWTQHRDASLEPEPRRSGASLRALTPPASGVQASERNHMDRTMAGLSLARELQNYDLWRYAPPSLGTGLAPPVALIQSAGQAKDELNCSFTEVPLLPANSPRQQTVPYVRPSASMDRSAHSYVPPPKSLTRGPSFIPVVMSASYVPQPAQNRSYVPPPGSVKVLSQPMPPVMGQATMPVLPMMSHSGPNGASSGPPGGVVQFLSGIKPSPWGMASATPLRSASTIDGIGTPGGTQPITGRMSFHVGQSG